MVWFSSMNFVNDYVGSRCQTIDTSKPGGGGT